MDEPDAEPLGDERRLRGDDALEQGERGVLVARAIGIVTGQRVLGQGLDASVVTTRREELERPYPQVARCDAHDDRAGQRLVPRDDFARRHGRERARRRDAQRDHRFAHEVFAEHGAERRATVTAA